MVKVAIPHPDALAVDCRVGVSKVIAVVVFKFFRPRNGKLARRIDFSKDHVGDAGSTVVAAEERLDKCPSLIRPGKLDRHARLVDNDRSGVDGENRTYERVSRSRLANVVAVIRLGLPLPVCADDKNGVCG